MFRDNDNEKTWYELNDSGKTPRKAKGIMASAGLPGNPREAKELLRKKFNVYNKVLIDNQTGYEHSYVFITRPELFLYNSSNGKVLSPNAEKRDYDLKILLEQEPDLYQYLDSTVDTVKTSFIRPMSNLLNEMSMSDAEFETKQSPTNRHGINLQYPTNYDKSLSDLPLSLTFQNDKYNTILKLLNVWSRYMTKISKGSYRPRHNAAFKNKFESSCSIYQFITREDGETIKFYAKWTGCYPQNLPFSPMSHKNRREEMDDISVSFYTSFFTPMTPSIIQEFNEIARMNGKKPKDNKIRNKARLQPDQRTLDDHFVENVSVVPKGNELKLKFY